MINEIQVTFPDFENKDTISCINIYKDILPKGYALWRTPHGNKEEYDLEPYQRIVKIDTLRIFLADTIDDYSNMDCVKIGRFFTIYGEQTQWETMRSIKSRGLHKC